MRTSVLAFVAVVTLAIGSATQALAADAPAAKNRVIFQVSDNDPVKWNLTLNNARNVQKDLGASAEIEIVAYGPGIGMLKTDSVVGNRVGEALASGVKIMACENTMQGQKLVKSDMLANVGYVSSGVVELMQKQQEGWSYIKP